MGGALRAPLRVLARLLLQYNPALRLHQVRYYGHYSNVTRARCSTRPPADSGRGRFTLSGWCAEDLSHASECGGIV